MEEKLNELLQKAGDAWEQKDYVTALDAYRQAADLGSADAAYNVSVMSMNELGTERDLETAMVYAVKAKQGGSEDAGELIDLLRQNASLLGERAYQAGDGDGQRGVLPAGSLLCARLGRPEAGSGQGPGICPGS